MTPFPLSAVALLLVLGGGPGKPSLQWEKGFDEALKKAKAAGKPVMIDFWAEWCGWCHRLHQTTYVDPRVVKLGEDFVAVRIDTEAGGRQTAIAQRYDVQTLPTILFVSPLGRVVLRVNGFQGPGQFPSTQEKARHVAGKVMGWEAAIEKDGRDARALMKLGTHLFEQEVYEESRELLSRAARHDERDPVPDRKRTRMLIGIIQTYDRKYSEAEGVLKDALALKPPSGRVEAPAGGGPPDELEPRLLFVLGRTYVNWGKLDKARTVMQQILSAHSASPVAAKARETLAALDRKGR